MTNFEWYRTFKTIYECDSISEASKKLFMTQPGVSKHLSALESQIGKKLFIRTARKIIPTEFGKFLYTQIITSVEGLEKVETKFNRDNIQSCPSIVIGCRYDYFKEKVLPELPSLNMAVTMHFASSGVLAEAVENSKIDLLIGTNQYKTYPHVFSKLDSEKLVLVASADLPIPEEIKKASSDTKNLPKWLKDQTWFAFDNELPFVGKFWKQHFNKRPQIIAMIVFSSFSGIISTMKKMNGLCVMPLYACEGALKSKDLKIAVPNLDLVENKLFCAHKSNSENLYEIRLFKEKMNFPL